VLLYFVCTFTNYFLLLVFVLFLQTESLKISSDHDMHDWFYDRDVKDPAVILHDKLISDALLNGTGPIKTEHSYSLNSDGDSLPDSPKSLQAKIDGKYCYNCIIDILIFVERILVGFEMLSINFG